MAYIVNSLENNPFKYFDLFPAKLKSNQEEILNRRFYYYKNLPDYLKPIFRNRLAKFIRSKKFSTREELILSEEIITLISASAIQLTFGLSNYKLNYFNEIIVYPGEYYSKITHRYHKGETNSNGILVFSWPDFLEGYNNSSDNLNLGLHEFSHALFINFKKDYEMDINFGLYYNEWKEIGTKAFFKLKDDQEKYFRAYAQVNLMEFFAVMVEHFFESPKQFIIHYPELYEILRKLLGQNPSLWSKK